MTRNLKAVAKRAIAGSVVWRVSRTAAATKVAVTGPAGCVSVNLARSLLQRGTTSWQFDRVAVPLPLLARCAPLLDAVGSWARQDMHGAANDRHRAQCTPRRHVQGLGELGHRPPTETIAELSAFSATRVVFAPKSRRRRAPMVNPVGIALTSPTATESELSVG